MILGLDYRELSPREGGFRWRWVMLRDGHSPLLYESPSVSFHGPDGREWMRFEDGVRIVRAGYAWNGCSPKRYCRLLRRWVGTPDYPATLRASRDHDADYQFAHTEHYPFDRMQADIMFRETLKTENFKLANAFYGAVRDFGGKHWGRDGSGDYSQLLTP